MSRVFVSSVVIFLVMAFLAMSVSGEVLSLDPAAAVAPVGPKTIPSLWSTNFLTLVGTQTPASYPNCRFGVTAWGSQQRDLDLIPNFGVGIYQDFAARSATVSEMAGAEHVQMLRLSQNRPNDPSNPNAPITTCGPDYGYTVNYPLDDGPGNLGTLVAARPGALWIVGNEPDRRIRQDDICPQQYAEAYHDIYHFIKERDPSAQIAVAGLVQVSPGRLQYLDIVLDTYLQRYGTTMPVDVWTMHIYIIPETGAGDAHIAVGTDPALAIPQSFDCDDPDSYCYAEHDDLDIFVHQVRMMRQWMRDNGYQNTPLVLTEFGILWPYHYYGTCSDQVCPENPPVDYGCFCDENLETFHPQRVADFAEATFDYLLSAKDQGLGYPPDAYRLVQQFVWYSVQTDGTSHASNLVEFTDTSYSLTVPGQRWNQYVTALPEELNLFPSRVPTVVGRAPDGVSPVTVTLTVEVRNNGNAIVDQPVTVTFYRDSALEQPIGSSIITDIGGCSRGWAVAMTTWDDLPTGSHRFWVRVDSTGVVDETDETDNVASGIVYINQPQLYLPLVASRR